MSPRKKLIEVALPLEAINKASAREKSIRHGHPSTLHLWWARRPLAAARAVLFASLVDDPDSPEAPPAFVEACRSLPRGKNAAPNDTPRQRLFDFIEMLVQWESTTDEQVLDTARELIRLSTGGNPPPLLDPFAGGGSIPLEAQRLGLEAHASDLNPVAVMINKALIEIPPKFAGQPPVNPRDGKTLTPGRPSGAASKGRDTSWRGAAGLAADVRYYGEWMRKKAWERIGHLYPRYAPHPRPLPQSEGGEQGDAWANPQNAGGEHTPTPGPSPRTREGSKWERWDIPPELKRKMTAVARRLRRKATPSEHILWQALRNRQLDGRKFRRQQPIGPFVVDFYCPSEWLVVEVDGPIHAGQREADAQRQQLIESLGIRFVRVPAAQVEQDLPSVLDTIRAAFTAPHHSSASIPPLHSSASIPPLHSMERGPGGEVVIAWLWARTVQCPNPACGAQMPLVRSFWLSKKKGKQAWVEPAIDHAAKTVRFTVKRGEGTPLAGTVNRRGATCIVCGTPVPFKHVREEGKAGRMGAQLMAIVTEGKRGRNYYAPTPAHEQIADVPIPDSAPNTDLPKQALGFRVQLYGMTKHRDLFTPRQLVALTTFSDLVGEAREQIRRDAVAAGLPDDDVPLREGGTGARAYAEAVSVYLAFAVDRSADYWSTIATPGDGFIRNTFARQAIPMTWDFAEGNPFSESTGNWLGALAWIVMVLERLIIAASGQSSQQDATKLDMLPGLVISTDPPYYNNIGYADLSDYFYIWMRRSLQETYPDIFSTVLVPKDPELVATPYRFNGDRSAAERHFESGLEHAFINLHRISQSEYPLSIYYAFKQSESRADENGEAISSTGWETMLEGLIHSGFTIDGTWPMRSERGARSVAIGTNALASSIILVCRPRPEDAPVVSRREFVAALKRELPAALKELQSGSIAPVDMAQAAIGPGMAVYSRYAKVLEANGKPLTVRTALQLINAQLDAYLAEAEGDADSDTRFAVSWFEQYGFDAGEFGVADVLARARNTSVDGLVQAGIAEAGGGKVRLLQPYELDPGWDPSTDRRVTVWEAAHHLLEALDTHGESGAAALLLKMNDELAADARALAYRLYSICERKGWAELARGYNALGVSWPQIQQLAAEMRQQGTQQDLFEM